RHPEPAHCRTSAASHRTIARLGGTVLPTSAPCDSTPSRAPTIPSWARARYLLGGAPSPRRDLAIEEIECEREDIGHGHLLAREADLRADRHRAFLRSIGKAPVGSPDNGRIERDHVHEVAEAERLSGERPGGAELHQRASGIEEELRGVVAGPAMNVDGAREVGSPRVIEPVVIGEPGIALRHRDEISRPLVVETELR